MKIKGDMKFDTYRISEYFVIILIETSFFTRHRKLTEARSDDTIAWSDKKLVISISPFELPHMDN